MTRKRGYKKSKNVRYYQKKNRPNKDSVVFPLVIVAIVALFSLYYMGFFDVYFNSNDIPEVSVTVPNQGELIPDIEEKIFEYTNKERTERGLSQLQYDTQLAEIAREHSQDMADNDFFSHINQRGEDPTDRASRHGYPIRKVLGGGYYSDGIAENIGMMPIGNVVGIGFVANNGDSIAAAQVASWMDSPGHRSNILNPEFDRIGIGVAYNGEYYSTQNFW